MSTLNKPYGLRVPWPDLVVRQAQLWSWILSFGFHFLLLVLIAFLAPQWVIPQRGVPGGDGTSIDVTLLDPGAGLALHGSGQNSEEGARGVELVPIGSDQPDGPEENVDTQPVTADSVTAPDDANPDQTAPATELSGNEETEIAADPNASDAPAGGRVNRFTVAAELDSGSGASRRGRPGAAASGGGRPMAGTVFFGVPGFGKKFVYVIDHSASMRSDHAIDVARAELIASLQELDASSQFQVIFYNMSHYLIPSRDPQNPYLRATEKNNTMARTFIRTVHPDGGTDHFPALKRALELKPDVIFFLTDADWPELDADEMDKIRKLNGGRMQIHSIEFGKRGPLKDDNFLKKLARQNNGTHRYHDVLELAKRRDKGIRRAQE